ncbi:ABC transporter substrate-binding protein [Anaerosporobacter sp.]
MKKKGLALLLALTLTTTVLAGCSSKKDNTKNETKTEEATDGASTDDSESTDGSATEVTNKEPSGQVIIGYSTDFNGSFIEGWGTNAGDSIVRDLIGTRPNFYGTAEMATNGEYVYNKTVLANDPEVTANEDGSKTFKFTLKQDLVWSDGSPITANDYIGNAMIYASPELAENEGSNTSSITLVGHGDFNSGAKKEFAGIHKIDDYTFSIDISSEYMPTYYEAYSAALTPIPFATYAPGVEIKDDGNGCYFSDNYSAELIKEPMEKERFNPTVTCGPYKFVSYDATNKQVTLEVNDKFKGNYEGKKAEIKTVIVKYVKDATMMNELESGNVDMLVGINGGDRINDGLDLVDEGKVDYATYLRNGYGMIAFHTDFGPTQFKSVRQAIAYCLDRITFSSQYTGGFGSLVNSEYGLAQWMYQERKDQIESELDPYAFNVDKAIEVLEADGWTLNEKGEPFVAGTDKVRYKEVDGKLMACEIQWANSEGNPVSDLLSTMLPESMEKAGMKLVGTTMDFPTLLNNYYREGIDEPIYNMYNLANGFTATPQIQYSYNPDKQYLGAGGNTNFWMDSKISEMGFDLDKTDPSDKEGYLDKWVAVMKELNEELPNIPLYSDEYHTFFNTKVKGYIGDDMFSIHYSLVYMSIEE